MNSWHRSTHGSLIPSVAKGTRSLPARWFDKGSKPRPPCWFHKMAICWVPLYEKLGLTSKDVDTDLGFATGVHEIDFEIFLKPCLFWKYRKFERTRPYATNKMNLDHVHVSRGYGESIGEKVKSEKIANSRMLKFWQDCSLRFWQKLHD